MLLGSSVVIAVLGAVLRYAYTPTTWHGLHLTVIGGIMIIVGLFGVILSVALWASHRFGNHNHLV
jgi:hypothetical protein